MPLAVEYVQQFFISQTSVLRSASQRKMIVPRYWLDSYGRRCFAIAGPSTWNSLPYSLLDSALSLSFLKTIFFAKYWQNILEIFLTVHCIKWHFSYWVAAIYTLDRTSWVILTHICCCMIRICLGLKDSASNLLTSASKIWPRPQIFGLGVASFSLSYYIIGHFSGKNCVKFGNFVNFSGNNLKSYVKFFHNYFWPQPWPQPPEIDLGLSLEVLDSFNITGYHQVRIQAFPGMNE